jgi:hypothetical protein
MLRYSLKKSILAALYFVFWAGLSASAKLGDWSRILDGSVGSGDGTRYKTGASGGGSALATFFGSTIMFISPFLGIYLIIQLVMAGYEWLTAAGEADKIRSAQKRIKHAIIGVIVIVAMYVIASFIYNMLSRATGYEYYGNTR